MIRKVLATLILTLLISNLYGQTDEVVIIETSTGDLEGTLLVPATDKKIPVALIIAGSGPTDRDGNNPVMKNNSLKMLASGLGENEIATLRYDKRGIGNSKNAGLKEIDLRFENYIEDAESCLDLLKDDSRFREVIVIGHSEGSLIGMIASQHKNVDKFVSVSGAGEPAGEILRKQLQAQPPMVLQQSLPILEKLETGETTDDVPQMLNSLFRPSVQPYMISWFKYNPQKEIAKLDKPILVIQGTTDIQVTIDEAEKLAKANPKAEIQIIDGMNHILKDSELDRQKNIQTYNQPDLPLKAGLIKLIVDFIEE